MINLCNVILIKRHPSNELYMAEFLHSKILQTFISSVMTGDNAKYWQNLEIFLTCIMISMNSFQGEKASNQKWCLVRSINGADYANEFMRIH